MPREINSAGYALVKEFEGLRLRAYLCPAGVWTIGYGHTGGVREGQLISQAEADRLLEKDLDWAEACVEKYAPGANGNEFAAMVSLCFNIGADPKSGFPSSSVCRLHNKGDKIGAARSFGLWNKATVDGRLVELPGLTRRRASEAALYLAPVAQWLAMPAMPQEVAPETPLKKSKTLWVAAAGGIAGVGSVADQVNSAAGSLSQVAEAVTSATSLVGGVTVGLRTLFSGAGLPAVLGIVSVVCIAVFAWRYFAKVRGGDARST